MSLITFKFLAAFAGNESNLTAAVVTFLVDFYFDQRRVRTPARSSVKDLRKKLLRAKTRAGGSLLNQTGCPTA